MAKANVQYGIKLENGEVMWLPVGRKLGHAEFAKQAGIKVVTRTVPQK